ncbi:winged helix-turn-helix domain-containing protein [Jatrophihabitans sp. GAS493]|uniref:winged helix-turn-helix domain-containing protein n=1 Tax=Jatrophihabitans sp. GAS493 TaxID=1907575 RepID=UPI000BB759FB
MGEISDRIEQALLGMIETGELGAGSKLPSERVLAERHASSRTTVRLVLTKLTAQGIIEPQHGRGYFVCPRPKARKPAKAT